MTDVPPRRRILDAMAASIADVGYRSTSIADIVRRAQTSRRTFYDHFADREACLVALLAAIIRESIRAIRQGVDASAPWEIQIRQAVQSWMDYVEPHAPVILVWIRESPAFGASSRRLKQDVTEAYINLIQDMSDTAPLSAAGYQPVPRHLAIMFIGGLREMVALAIENDKPIQDVTEKAVDAAVSLFGKPSVDSSS